MRHAAIAVAALLTAQPASSQTITPFAGNGALGSAGDGGSAAAASLNQPHGIALDAAGNCYIADVQNNRVRRVDASNGTISRFAGNEGQGFSGDGPATSESLFLPYGVAVDGSGTVYIADTFNNRIRRVDALTGVMSTVAGNGLRGFSGDEGLAVDASLNWPQGVSLDVLGNLYIADTYNDRVRRVDAATGNITTVAGSGPSGLSGDGPALAVRLSYPIKVAAVGRGVYIADLGNDRIRHLDVVAGAITTVAGGGPAVPGNGDGGPATSAKLSAPIDIAVDILGNLYIADLNNSRVRKVDADTQTITTVAGNGIYGSSGDFGEATAASLANPTGVAVDALGNLFIADNATHRVRRVSAPNRAPTANAGPDQTLECAPPSGTVVTLNGSTSSDPDGDTLSYEWRDAADAVIATTATAAVPLPAGTQVLTLKVTDPGGHSATDTVTVAIADTAQPSLSVATNLVTATVPSPGAVALIDLLAAAGVTAADACAGVPELQLTGVPAGGLYPVGDTPVTITASDDAGNSTSASVTVRVMVAPVFAAGVAPASLDFGFVALASTGGPRVVTVQNTGTGPLGVSGVQLQGVTTTAGIIHTVAGGSLSFPNGVAVDGRGNLFIADFSGNVIRRVDAVTGVVTTAAGGGAGVDGGPASDAILDGPNGVAVDAAGNVFIAESNANVIRRVDVATGIITTVAGNGTAGYGGDGAAAISGSLYYPYAVAVDAAGNLFIADLGNNCVRRVDAATGIIMTVAGNGSLGYGGDGGLATDAALSPPVGVAVDASGNVYVSDQGNNRVRRVDAVTGIITTVAGDGSAGYSGDGGPATAASLFNSIGIAVDGADNLLIADYGNRAIRRVDVGTGLIATVAGGGAAGDGGAATDASLSNPYGVAVDATGNLFLSEPLEHRVRRVDGATSDSSSEFAQTNDCGVVAPGGSCTVQVSFTPSQLGSRVASLVVTSDDASSPHTVSLSGVGLAASTTTTLASSLNPSVLGQEVTLTATVSSAAGTPGGSVEFYDGTTVLGTVVLDATGQARLLTSTLPVGLRALTASYLASVAYGASTSNVLVQTVEVGTPALQLGVSSLSFGSRRVGTTATLGLVVGNTGTGPLTVSGLQLQGVTTTAGMINTVAAGSFGFPNGVAVDGRGNLLIADFSGNLILRVDAVTGAVTTVAGGGVGEDGGLGSAASLNGPNGVAADAAGNVFIAESNAHVIRRVDAETGIITTVAGNGSPGYTADGVAATASSLYYPYAVAVDGRGDLFVADLGNNRVRRVDAATGIITTFAGSGSLGYSGDGGPAASADLSPPVGVALDASGNVYVSDQGNNRVRRVDAATGIITTVAGNGAPGYSGDGGSAKEASLNNSIGIAVDAAGDLFIADYGNSVIRRVGAASGLITTVAGGGAGGDGGAATSASVVNPYGVAVDASGNLYLSEPLVQRVRRVDGLTSDSASDFAQTNDCGVVAPGASCTVQVSFTPSRLGTRVASLVLTNDAAGSPHTLSLSGTGVRPSAVVSPASLVFAGTPVSQASALQEVVFANNGNGALSLGGIALGGMNAGDFVQVNDCGAVLAPNTNCRVRVTFAPAAGGARTATLQFTDDAAGSPHIVSLSGTATQAAIALVPETLAFGGQVVGTSSPSQTVSLSNPGSAALTVSSILASGDFAVSSDCGSSVAPGAACTISVVFAPTAAGLRAGVVAVVDNAPGSPHVVALSGTGTAPVAALTPASLAFGSLAVGVPSAPKTATLANTGDGPLTIASIVTTGDYAFASACPIAPATLPPGGTCTIDVTFTATATGSRPGTLRVTDNASGSPRTVNLTGTGAVVSVSPTSLAFGSVPLQTTSAAKTVTVNNSTLASLPISSIAITTLASDYAQTNNCPATLASGATCVVTVTFRPTVAGSRAGQLRISYGASVVNVALSGTGTFNLGVSPASLTFAKQALGTTSAAKTVTLTNGTGSPISITGITSVDEFPVQSNTCGTSLAAGTTCTFAVVFAPSAAGTRTGQVTIADNATGNPHKVNLTGTGTIPLTVSPTSLGFGSVIAGVTSAAKTVTLTNSNPVAITFASIAVSSDYALANGCPARMDPNTSCTLSVTFTPTVAGSRPATLDILSDATSSPQKVNLTGAGTLPLNTSGNLAFGSVVAGVTSAAKTITLTNPSPLLPISIASIAPAGDYAATDSCAGSIAPSGTCTVSVTFRPTATGARNSSVVITSNATNNPRTSTLTGTGTLPLTVSPTSVAFGNQAINTTSSPKTVTLTNASPLLAIPITNVTLTGTVPGDYAQTNNCGSSIPAGGSCTVTLTFRPTATGARAAQLAITSGATTSPNNVTLSGRGI